MQRARIGIHIRRYALGAVIVAAAAGAALNGSCFLDTRTNLCETTGLRCPEEQVCAPRQGICVPAGGCGDGILNRDRGEECDDGDLIDGDGCDSNCRLTGCGNGIETAGEQCDLGPMNSNTGACLTSCQIARCGDGHVHAGQEACDMGLANSDAGSCLASCQLARCGDGYIRDGAEVCDDGNDQNCGTCNNNCQEVLRNKATGTIVIVTGGRVPADAWFKLNDGEQFAYFVYKYNSDQQVPPGLPPDSIFIKIAETEPEPETGPETNVGAFVNNTLAKINESNLKIDASPSGASVKLTHQQIGISGNIQIERSSGANFSVDGMAGGTGADCAGGVGCKSDEDCMSGTCNSMTSLCE